jgi:hypothetical protein
LTKTKNLEYGLSNQTFIENLCQYQRNLGIIDEYKLEIGAHESHHGNTNISYEADDFPTPMENQTRDLDPTRHIIYINNQVLLSS